MVIFGLVSASNLPGEAVRQSEAAVRTQPYCITAARAVKISDSSSKQICQMLRRQAYSEMESLVYRRTQEVKWLPKRLSYSGNQACFTTNEGRAVLPSAPAVVPMRPGPSNKVWSMTAAPLDFTISRGKSGNWSTTSWLPNAETPIVCWPRQVLSKM